LENEGIELAVWRIHRRIGMSDGLFTNMLLRETGLDLEPQRNERLRARHAEAYNRRSAAIRPLPGVPELLACLSAAGIPWAIATSGRIETAGPVIDTLGVDRATVPVIARDMVAHAEPAPDLFLAAAEALGQPIASACVVGDSVWDMPAARRAGVWAWGCFPAATPRTNSSRPVPTGSMPTPPITSRRHGQTSPQKSRGGVGEIISPTFFKPPRFVRNRIRARAAPVCGSGW